MRIASRSTWTGCGLAIVVLAVTGWGAVALNDAQLISWFTDDTFYYLNVARHVAQGRGFTFDGVHATNGFQPLWMLVLVPLCQAFPGDFPPLRALILLQSMLLAGSTVLLWRSLRGPLGEAAGAATSLLLVGMPAASFLWLGMESSLFLLLLLVTWRSWVSIDAGETPRAGDCWRLGACCSLLFLARLEGAFALVVVLLLGARKLRRSDRPAAHFTALLLPPAAVAAAYLIWNRWSFGLWLPISGAIKARWFATLGLRPRLLGILDVPWIGRHLLERVYGSPLLPEGTRLLSFATLLTGVVLAWHRRTRLVPLLRDTGTTFLVLCCGGIMVLDQIVVGPFLADWAEVPGHVLTVVLLGLALFRSPFARRAALVAALVLCSVRIPAQARRANHWRRSFTGSSLVLAEWISRNVPPQERIGSPYAGVLGYFGHRTVVNLDGLVNDLDFYRKVLIGGEWDAYLEATHVKWLADVGCGGDPPLATLKRMAHGRFRTARCYVVAHKIDDAWQEDTCALLLWNRVAEDCD